MIVVAGATGLLGGRVCRMLVTGSEPVRAMVRATADRVRRGDLEAIGVEIAEADLRDRGSIEQVCRGAKVMISTASAMTSRRPGDSLENVDAGGHLTLVQAAERAGVEQFIFISLDSQTVDSPLQRAKRQVEARLRSGTVPYTILQPSYFIELWLSQTFWPVTGLDWVRRRAKVAGSGDRPVNWISVGDVARFIVGAIGNEDALGTSLRLGGPDALSFLDVISMFERLGGKPFTIERISEDVLRGQIAAALDPFEESFAALVLSSATGSPLDYQPALQKIPLQLTSVETYASQIMKYS